MQEEALNRVKEMQKRSRNYVGGAAGNGSTQRENLGGFSTNNTANNSTSRPRSSERSDPIQSLLGGILGGGSKKGDSEKGELFNIAGIAIDEEKALIGMMIYILYKQGADIKLLLALGYLLI